MGRYNSTQSYPKEFYADNGDNSYGLINPNKLISGSLLGDMTVGRSGPKLSASTNSIIVGSGSTQVVIDAGGISIGGTTISADGGGVPTVPYLTVYGPYSIAATNGAIYSGDGTALFTPTVGDMIIQAWCYTTVAWSGGDGTGGALYIGPNLSAASNTVSSHVNNSMWALSVTTTTQTGMSSVVSSYVEAGSAVIQVNPNNTAVYYPRGPFKVISNSKPICAKAVAPSGAASQFTAGQSQVYISVLKNLS